MNKSIEKNRSGQLNSLVRRLSQSKAGRAELNEFVHAVVEAHSLANQPARNPIGGPPGGSAALGAEPAGSVNGCSCGRPGCYLVNRCCANQRVVDIVRALLSKDAEPLSESEKSWLGGLVAGLLLQNVSRETPGAP